MSIYGYTPYERDKEELDCVIEDFVKNHPLYELMEIIAYVLERCES
jgi:hypothetical protein